MDQIGCNPNPQPFKVTMSHPSFNECMESALESCRLAESLSPDFRAVVRAVTHLRIRECQGQASATSALEKMARAMPEAVANARELDEADSQHAMISMAVGELLDYSRSFQGTPSIRRLLARAFNLALPESN